MTSLPTCLTGVSSARSGFVSVNCTILCYNKFDISHKIFQIFTYDDIKPILCDPVHQFRSIFLGTVTIAAIDRK